MSTSIGAQLETAKFVDRTDNQVEKRVQLQDVLRILEHQSRYQYQGAVQNVAELLQMQDPIARTVAWWLLVSRT